MSQWFYADRDRNHQGPLAAEQLAQLFQQGQLDLQTLVWREGLASWQPLAEFADELALLSAVPVTASAPAHDALNLEPLEAGVDPTSAAPAATPTTRIPDTGTDSQGRAVFGSAEPSYVVNSPYTLGTPLSASDAAPPSSPYAAPRASLSEHRGGVRRDANVVYAGFWKRVAAYFVDTFVVGILGAVIGAVIGGITGALFSFGGNLEPSIFMLMQGFNYLLGIALGATYYAWFHASVNQATLGKMAVGIKVVRSDGDPISFMRGVGRYFATMLSTLILGIGFLMAGFTERKQALHDMVCDTLVVDKWAYTGHSERQSEQLSTVTWVILILGGLLFLGMLSLFVVGFAALANMAAH